MNNKIEEWENVKGEVTGKFIYGDCLEGMKTIPSHSVDMILCDLPYGTTQNKWDSIIPLTPLWEQYWRICKGAVVLTAQTPFDKILGVSCINYLRYEWIWEKNRASGHLNSAIQPMKSHENILVFYKFQPTYNPQKTNNHKPTNKFNQKSNQSTNYGNQINVSGGGNTDRFPRSVQFFQKETNKNPLHPTQKPVALFEYLIRTYTNPGDLVLDNCAGSGTSAIAAINTKRRWICMEKDETYFNLAVNRIDEHCESMHSMSNYQ